MKTPQLLARKIAASLVCPALLIFTGSVSADNTGLGGTITYTDSNGANPVSSPPYVGGYVVHTFTANGTLTLPSSVSAADVLVVAGGGGGGGPYGDGGGAGGLIYTSLSLAAGSYSATIGAGGSGTSGDTSGANGNNSVFSTLTALGGGGGGNGYPDNVAGRDGGSGGGGGGGYGHDPFNGGAFTQPSSASGGYGNNGYGDSSGAYGGGGGAGAAAISGGGGGNGLQYDISGVNTYYAGGGAGINGGGSGGLGGGGNPGASGNAGGNGAANTGGGGGGGFGNTGGSGGSGIVIVRYPYVANPPLSILLSSPTNSQNVVGGFSVSATALVAGGATPYSVTYHYKLTTASSYMATAAVGPFDEASAFTKTLDALPLGVYQIYATVADSAAGTATSVTNTFTVYASGNTGQGGTITYTDPSGANPVSGPPYVGGYVVQTFTTNGTLILPSSVSADVLVVAGGGGGGTPFGCGGGAGGLIYSNLSLSGGSYNATVGAGGRSGVDGNNSVFGTLTALGGGAGGSGYNPISAGHSGGSGGGAGGNFADPQPGAGTATQPSSASGGYGNDGYSGSGLAYGGGGGAGSAGLYGSGGDGLQYEISGVSTYYSGGGAGIISDGVPGLGGGGSAATSGNAGGNGAANSGGGGGGGWNASGGSGGSGIVIVRYPYLANPPLSVVLTSPVNDQSFLIGSSISATALVVGGTGPYSLTYHYKLTTAASYTAVAAAGPFSGTSTFAQTLGALPLGAYQIYATVADSAARTATSTTNTVTVSLTTIIPVQDANFETPGVLSGAYGWAHIAAVWNPDNGTYSEYQQNSLTLSPNVADKLQFTNVCPGGVDWYVLLNGNTVSITQDLLTTVNVGDTLSMTFYGGRGLPANTADGGVFTATILVGSTPYSMQVDTTVLTNGIWQSYTLTQVVTNSGELSIQFSAVSGNPWLDNISVTRTVPSPAPVRSILGTPRISDGNLILIGTGGTPGAAYTWLSTTNLLAPITWTTNTGTLDSAGAFSNSIPIGATRASFFRLP